jgi:hypothetical protein
MFCFYMLSYNFKEKEKKKEREIEGAKIWIK